MSVDEDASTFDLDGVGRDPVRLEPRRVWPDDDASNQITDEHRLAELTRHPAARKGSGQRKRQIEDELGMLHAREFPAIDVTSQSDDGP